MNVMTHVRVRVVCAKWRIYAISGLLCFALPFAIAQEANVLGLPAVPQNKNATNASGGAGGKAPPVAANPRDLLAGELGLQHSALDGLGRLIVTTKATFATAGAKSSATDAARQVQRELSAACGKQCKPEKMPAPIILPSGQLQFELAFRPLYQHLSQAQFIAAIQSKPLNLTAAQMSPPKITPAPASTPPATTTQ